MPARHFSKHKNNTKQIKNMKKTIPILMCALAFGAALMMPNCATAQTDNPSPQTKLADSVALIQTETTATRDQLEATLGALNALTKQQKGDLQPTYDAYAAEVKKTHAVAAQTAARIIAMQDASKEYFDAWKAQINEIKNESLRAKATKRMDAVQKNYNEVIKSLQEATERFKPFLSNLDDMQKMLANDVTPGGVKAVRGVADDANWTMKKVRSSISDAIEELGDMAKSLSSQKSS
jgi:ABC-type transporter Mla subunit MlaD